MAKEIGLVLSGGGVKAIAHIGFIKVLLENNIIPTRVSGTSAGALVSALYANGYSPEEMISFFKQTPLFKFTLYAINKPGLMDSDKYAEFFEDFFPKNSFEDLKYPLTVTATDLLSGKLTYFNKGELIKPLIASSALPPVFSPIEIDNKWYCDGGVLNNFPVEPIKKDCDVILGSFVNPITEINKEDINSSLKLLYRVYDLGVDLNNIKKFKQCNYVFAPIEINEIGVLDASVIDKAYEIGYKNAQKDIETILNSIQ